MMTARYLPIAQCWRVFFGSSLCDIRGERHWPNKEWLKASLRAAGLTMNDNTNEITAVTA